MYATKDFTMRLDLNVKISDAIDLSGYQLVIGFFDGIHIGHQALIEEAKKEGKVALLTFSMGMKAFLRNRKTELLLSEDEKIEGLESLGVEQYLEMPFDHSLKDATIDEFLNFLRRLNPKRIIVGEDFTFARKAEGKADNLNALKKDGIGIVIHSLVRTGQGKISSTLIKELLREGKIKEANALLGYRFFYQGSVIHGLENGRKIDFPTANMEKTEDKFLLGEGVYKTLTVVDGKTYRSMTNIGNHPTVSALDKIIIETYLIDYSGDLYSKNIKVEFLSFIRPQKKFGSLSELKDQLSKDVIVAKEKAA